MDIPTAIVASVGMICLTVMIVVFVIVRYASRNVKVTVHKDIDVAVADIPDR